MGNILQRNNEKGKFFKWARETSNIELPQGEDVGLG
jgi:hypothetical protein